MRELKEDVMGDVNPARAWVFRGLVAIGAGWLLYSWFQPWWSLDIAMLGPERVIVRPWGEEANLGSWTVVFDIPQMPPFFEPFAWTFLGLCVAVLLASLFVKDRTIKLARLSLSLPRAMVGAVGISYLAVPVFATLALLYNLNQFEVDGVTVPLQGTAFLDFGQPWTSNVTSTLREGYWLAWGAGAFLFILALLRPRIIGRN